MSKPAHSLDRVLGLALAPWALEEHMLRTVTAVLVRRTVHGPHALEAGELAALRAHPSDRPAPASAVALIPLHGVIAPRITALSDISGGTTFEGARQQLQQAVEDPRVSTIVLDINSPGGSVLGARVFARALLQARTKKPVVAQIEYVGHSAAYWAAACATEVVAAPGSFLGAIGVYTIHDDISRALDAEGITRTLIAAGAGKLDGHESLPLSPAAKARYQAHVDESYSHFAADVAAGRGVSVDVVTKQWEGHAYTASEGLARRMVDKEATLEETLARFGVRAAVDRDTPQEPPAATGQDRDRLARAYEATFRASSFTS